MTKQEKIVIEKAIKWWENHRPLSFNLRKHLDNPDINCLREVEASLAEEVALLLRARRNKKKVT